MKVLLAAINAKYIHSNLGIYSLKTYGEKMLKEWGLAEQAEISLAEYTINHQMDPNTETKRIWRNVGIRPRFL